MNGTFCCVVDLSDRLKSNSKRVIEKLNEMNIQPVMVTGDIPSTAEAVASLCGIETLFSQQTPIDKANIVIEYQNQGKIVGMIGDGINDSPALARSDVGFSVFNGTDIAHDAASIILMNDNLFDLIVAIDLSRFIVARIKWNFAWALAYNFISLPIAAGCLVPFGIVMHPALAGVAMSLSSISVLLSSLAIKLYKPPK
ncbi:ATPase, P-type, K/Mg/Cd/Cu/Zn/Na/Ca/Na/H-transporter [Rozella allomycis CSF55]|uniref:ATPase, P-type, K/Mg/Cd/Cu/Zn/Na/Ca/Na/H-transporter n=1 Tax=Rozella allomycis (strain CSF55) TaxID=988480 RepID=A0A075B2N7_ROZAC|nr:HAD-like domain-containing protein [Rozella allomycis CSF55]RKP16721.1 ATPase, P-type, K/Mg/Cd/Cu/Zn/Na/Ca/Na/H-transporter [Rozella allomycis CSF55]|eukprot:EPZ36865.1 HAD-like domain-containing protein [Rozella allomycis CSF55]